MLLKRGCLSIGILNRFDVDFSFIRHMQEVTKQGEGPIAKKPKTVPLQEAEKEMEEGLRQLYSKVGVCGMCVWQLDG